MINRKTLESKWNAGEITRERLLEMVLKASKRIDDGLNGRQFLDAIDRRVLEDGIRTIEQFLADMDAEDEEAAPTSPLPRAEASNNNEKGVTMIHDTDPQINAALLAILNGLVDRAVAAYPEEIARIERGADFVRQGAVDLHANGTATVYSGEQRYEVNGHCECGDAQYRAPEGRCKHRWAKALYRRMLAEYIVAYEQFPGRPIEEPTQETMPLFALVCNPEWRLAREQGGLAVSAGH
jgi:hypothetical protein